MFQALGQRFSSIFSGLRGKVSESDLKSFTAQIKDALLESDVALSVAESFSDRVYKKSQDRSDEINKSTNPAQKIFEIVNSELTQIVGGSARRVRFAKTPPTVILLVGLQGAGKTTLAGKLANYLKVEGNTPLLVAADLQRPNAVTQLQVVGDSIKVPVFAPEPGNGTGDAVDVARQSVKFAKDKLHNFVIIDTAGRLSTQAHLMDELKKVKRVIGKAQESAPHETILVIDGNTGQNGMAQVKAFHEALNLTGIIVTKLDGTAKGGILCAIASELSDNPPSVLAIGLGEQLSDLKPFNASEFAKSLIPK